MIKDNHNKFKELRTQYTVFVYESYSITEDTQSLKVEYFFNLADKYFFKPTIEFIKGKHLRNKMTDREIQNFVFHIVMIKLCVYFHSKQLKICL